MSQVISQLPRFALEAIAFGGMLLWCCGSMAQSGSFTSALPIIALYAFAIACCRATDLWRGHATALCGPALEALHKDLFSLQPAIPIHNTRHAAHGPLP